ncbi:MAG: retropepsin-like aspartic protease [Dysgonamonadaceae bacterium]
MKKHLMYLFLLFIASLSVNAQTTILNVGGTKSSGYHIILPCEYKTLPIVNVKIGKKTYRFLFDTGAVTSIGEKIINDLKLEPVDKMNVFDSAARPDSLYVYSLPEIFLGEVAFNDIPTLQMKDEVFNRCIGFDGIIGSNLLRNSVVRFSYPDKTIEIADNPESFNLNQKYVQKMIVHSYQSSPFIKTVLTDRKTANVELLFDSGMSGFYNLSLRHFYLFRDKKVFSDIVKEGRGRQTYGFYGIAPETDLYRLRIPQLEIGKSKFKNVLINTTNYDDSRVGIEWLKYGVATLDYKNQKFYFEPHPGAKTDLFRKELPLSLIPQGNKLIVGVIWDERLNDRISVGDQVLSIDDINFENMDECELFVSDFNFDKKDSYLFKIKDKQGNVKEIQIDKE